jgi:protein-tyrosine phosphatase
VYPNGTDEPPRVVDIHTHVLHGVDDGPRDIDQSLRMLEAAARDGTSLIFATPHAHRTSREEIERRLDELRAAADERGIDIEIALGAEIRLGPEIFDALHDGRYISLNGGSWILLELPLNLEWPSYFDRVITRLDGLGRYPVLAHAERYTAVQSDPEVLLPLVTGDIPIQINADALLGGQGRTERATCERLLQGRLAHIIASDAHNDGRRAPVLSQAWERASELVGAERVREMKEIALKVATDRPLTLPAPDLDQLRRFDASGSWVSTIARKLRGLS